MITIWIRAVALCLWITAAHGQVKVYQVGRGGLSWDRSSLRADWGGGKRWRAAIARTDQWAKFDPATARFRPDLVKGTAPDFTAVGQPRAWSNDGLFNQINGPLRLVDGDPSSSSEGSFKSVRNQAGATFFWDLGSPFPINRVRFYPDPNDPDSFIKAFELLVNDGADFNEINRPTYQLLRRVEGNRSQVVNLEFPPLQGRFLQLKVLSKSAFNLAEFEIFGEGFVPVSSYVSDLHSFGEAVNFGQLRIHATRLVRGAGGENRRPAAILQMRSGADDTPLSYFRRDRDTGSVDEVSFTEYNADLPRACLVPPRSQHRRGARGIGAG